MGTRFSITDNAVNQHANNLDASISALNGQAQSFIAAIEPLPAVWKGTSYGSWAELTAAWNEAMVQLNKALADIKGRVGNAGGLYDRYHQEQTAELEATMAAANWDNAKFRA